MATTNEDRNRLWLEEKGIFLKKEVEGLHVHRWTLAVYVLKAFFQRISVKPRSALLRLHSTFLFGLCCVPCL